MENINDTNNKEIEKWDGKIKELTERQNELGEMSDKMKASDVARRNASVKEYEIQRKKALERGDEGEAIRLENKINELTEGGKSKESSRESKLKSEYEIQRKKALERGDEAEAARLQNKIVSFGSSDTANNNDIKNYQERLKKLSEKPVVEDPDVEKHKSVSFGSGSRCGDGKGCSGSHWCGRY